MKWNLYSLYWAAWLVVGFLAPELYALSTDHNNTLSAQVWHLDGHGLSFGRYFVSAFTLWLWLHFTFRIFT